MDHFSGLAEGDRTDEGVFEDAETGALVGLSAVNTKSYSRGGGRPQSRRKNRRLSGWERKVANRVQAEASRYAPSVTSIPSIPVVVGIKRGREEACSAITQCTGLEAACVPSYTLGSSDGLTADLTPAFRLCEQAALAGDIHA